MIKRATVIILFLLIHNSSFPQPSEYVWTFDCGSQQWGNFAHTEAFDVSHQLANQFVNSGHLELRHKQDSYHNWLFGPTSMLINADENKHLHFSLTLNNEGTIPEAGIMALMVWNPPGDMSILYSKTFQIFAGQMNYHIDMTDHPDWKGNVNINRFHFPQGDFTTKGYTPETAVYRLDWLAITSKSDNISLVQDTTAACVAQKIELSNQISVIVNGTSVVFESEMIQGNIASLKIDYTPTNGMLQTQEYGTIKNGEIAVHLNNLEVETTYEYSLIAINTIGSDTIHGKFTTRKLQTNYKLWSFDCWYEGWKGHSVDLEHIYLNQNGALKYSKINSGSFIRNQGFALDASEYKYLSIGINVLNAPGQNITGNIKNMNSGGNGFNFEWNPAENVIRVPLNDYEQWNGDVDHIWLYLAKNAPVNMIINIDWIAFSDNNQYYPDKQQTNCIPDAPVLSNLESVVFGNRASMKAILTGGFGEAILKLWQADGDTVSKNQLVSEETGVYFSNYDLECNTNYFWQMQISNPSGSYMSEIQQFTTEENVSEAMPVNYWMTPSPFKLTQNVNDHLFDQSNWEEAANLVDVYKIHGAYFNSLGNFGRLNLPKLIFTINKNRMRLAWESIIQGDRDGAAYADEILQMINKIRDAGGKLEFLTWDGMMFRCFYASHTHTIFRSPEEGLEAVAEAARIVKEKYPDFEIIPLPNLPNWDFKEIPHNAGDWAGTTGVSGWDYLCDIYLEKSKQKGVTTNFIEIDHPFNYYHKTSREVSKQRISAMKNYCEQNNMKLILIVNSVVSGLSSNELTDAKFKSDCLQYIEDLEEDGITFNYIDLESWYPYPQYLTPETKENSFTNILRDVGTVFINSPNSVNDSPSNNSTLKNRIIYTNHENQNLVIQIHQYVEKVSLNLIDVSGKVYETRSELSTGNHVLKIDYLPMGVYFLQLKSDNEAIVHKFLKQQ